MAERDGLDERHEAIGGDGDPALIVEPRVDAIDLRSDPLDPWRDEIAAAAPERLAAVEARLTRIESILDADLDKLGPAVLADSVSDLDAELHAMVARLTAVEPSAPSGPDGLPGPDPALAELVALVARLDERLLAQSRYLAATSDATGEALQRLLGLVEDPVPGLTPHIDTLASRVEQLSLLAEEPVPPDPMVEQIARAVASVSRRLGHLERSVEQAMAADERMEARLHELISRLEGLTDRLF